jgi:hypothetical protein
VYALCVGLAVTDASVDVAGAVSSLTPTTNVSVSAIVEGKLITTGIFIATPARAAGTVPTEMLETISCAPAALAAGVETIDKSPPVNAATATSATRLKVVFVDIYFLSISRSREFLPFGLNQISLIRFDESHVLIHQIPHRVSGRGEETYF